VQNKSATVVYEAIKRAGVLIKNLDGTDAALAGCLRVTVGTAEENAAFLTAVKQTL
jgi:histidinol-phosphate aminotransferase